MSVFGVIGKALNGFGKVMDDAYMTYHRGPGWQQEQEFIDRYNRMREEVERTKLENAQKDQELQEAAAQRAAAAADRAAFEARASFEQKAAAAGIGGFGGDLAGTPGSTLAGPPTEEADAAFAAPPTSIPGLSDSPEATMLGRAMGVREQEEERAKRAAEEEKIARVLAKEQEQQRRQAESDARSREDQEMQRQRMAWEREDRAKPKVAPTPKPLTMREARDMADANFDMPEGPERDANVDKLARKLFRESQEKARVPPAARPQAGAARPALQQQQFPASVRIGGRSVPWAQVPPDIQAEVMQRMGAQ